MTQPGRPEPLAEANKPQCGALRPDCRNLSLYVGRCPYCHVRLPGIDGEYIEGVKP